MDVSILRLVIGVVIAFFVGKLVSKVKLPSILGWLIAGMILGPHAVGLLSDSLLNASWYQPLLSVFESAMGLMIGTELIIRKLKKSGKQIVVTTMYQSLTTFFMVTLFFSA